MKVVLDACLSLQAGDTDSKIRYARLYTGFNWTSILLNLYVLPTEQLIL